MKQKYRIPDCAIRIYWDTRDKIGLTERLYGKSDSPYGVLIKWQRLYEFEDEDIQAMQSQIVAEIMGWA